MDNSSIIDDGPSIHIHIDQDRPIIVDPHFLSHPDLDAECWGVMLYLISMSEDTDMENIEIAYHAKIPMDRLLHAISRLEYAGYLYREGTTLEICDRPGVRPRSAKVQSRCLPASPTHTPTPGYIYLIRASTGQYKIGHTKCVPERMKAFGIHLPFPVELVHTIIVANMRKEEDALHAHFADKRLNGEWFDLALDDVAYIKSL